MSTLSLRSQTFGRLPLLGKALPQRKVLLVAFLIALFAVLAALPGRWEGSRTDTDAHIPLKPPSVVEVAALIKAGEARIRQLTEDSVTVVTASYIERAPVREGQRKIVVEGNELGLQSGSWEGYSLAHRLERGPLEHFLGRALTPSDVDPRAVAAPISFASFHLWLYVLAEVLALTAFLLLAFFIWNRVRPLALRMAVLATTLTLLPILLVPFYSPAFLDADFFYQRIVVEQALPPLLMAFPYLFWPAILVFAFSAIQGLSRRFFRGTEVHRRRISRVFAFSAVTLFAIAPLAVTSAQYLSFENAAGDTLEKARQKVSSKILESLRAEGERLLFEGRTFNNLLSRESTTLQPAAHEALEGLRRSLGVSDGFQLFVSLPKDHVMFLIVGPQPYADIRNLGGGAGVQNGLSMIRRAQRTSERVTTGLAGVFAQLFTFRSADSWSVAQAVGIGSEGRADIVLVSDSGRLTASDVFRFPTALALQWTLLARWVMKLT